MRLHGKCPHDHQQNCEADAVPFEFQDLLSPCDIEYTIDGSPAHLNTIPKNFEDFINWANKIEEEKYSPPKYLNINGK